MRRMARLGLATLALLAAIGSSAMAAAQPPQSRKKLMWGPLVVNHKSTLPIYRDLGVGIYQMTINWSDVAPTKPRRPTNPSDPAYLWPKRLTYAVRKMRHAHIRVALTLTQTPEWANGGKGSQWAPTHAGDFADFAEAVAKRFPSIRLWMIWGEPNREGVFAPMSRHDDVGPRRYAKLLDRVYGRLKAISPRNLIIGGNTFTSGKVVPLTFLRRMVLPSGRHPRLDLYGHNPFTRRQPRLEGPPLGEGKVDFGGLDDLVRKLDEYYPGQNVRLFLSEFTLPTDHASRAFSYWFTRDVAASWLTSAMRIAYDWQRIYTLGWYSLYDERPMAGQETNWGLLDWRGRRKPAYFAYRRNYSIPEAPANGQEVAPSAPTATTPPP
jgi:hypothetical protein